MSTPGVPPWGCPWHGLVKGGRLELPNGQSMDFPQPANGYTTLVRVPGLPAVTPTGRDVSLGRQWRNTAIIAGGYLHGRSLNGGYIYVDTENRPWLVLIAKAADLLSITLRRFGVLGGELIERTFEVPLDRPAGSSNAVYFEHATQTGNRAVLSSIHYGLGLSAWIEISISGAADKLVITATVLKSIAEVSGDLVDTASSAGWASLVIEREELPLGPNQIRNLRYSAGEFRRVGAIPGHLVTLEAGQSRQEVAFRDRVLGYYYDDAGTRVTATYDCGWTRVTSYEYSLESAEDGYDREWSTPNGPVVERKLVSGRIRATQTDRFEAFAIIKLDGAVAGRLELWTSRAQTRFVDYLGQDGFAQVNGGETLPPEPMIWSSGYVGDATVTPSTVSIGNGAFARVRGWREQNGRETDISLYSGSVSNQVSALYATADGTKTYDSFITPSGAVPDSRRVAEFQRVYASWCPETKQLAIDTAPVCWV